MKLAGVAALLLGCGFHAHPGTADGGDGPSADGPPVDVPTANIRRLTFDNSASTIALDEFPVMVALSPQRVDYAQVADPTTDLRFEDLDGSNLSFEVERWTPGGVSIVWVKVPRIDAMSMTDAITMSFGAGIGAADPIGVWTQYEQVTHLGDLLTDSTGHGHDATPAGVTSVDGKIATGTMFAGDNARLSFTGNTFDQWPRGTLEGWIHPNYGSANLMGNEPRVIDNGGALTNGRLFSASTSSMVFQIDVQTNGGTTSYLHPQTQPNTWTYFAWTYDHDTITMYRNGTSDGADQIGGHNFPNAGPIVLGSDQGNAANMTFDELRVSQTDKPPQWIRAQYLSMTDAFVTYSTPPVP